VNAAKIPQELKDRPQWVLWRLEKRRYKDTKIPISVNGSMASATDPRTWASFAEVLDVLLAAPDRFQGLGYVFSADDPFTGIDLDNDAAKPGFTCMHDDGFLGELTDEAQAIIDTMNSYAEYSQSGSGIHILVKAVKPGERNRKGNFEMYDRERFFVVTGNHVEGTPLTIEERQSEVDGLYSRMLGEAGCRKKKSTVQSVLANPQYDDHYVFILAKDGPNGEKFSRLFAGDWQELFTSQSEAELSFCNLLAKHTKDEAQIDRIMRSSGLYREKWERADYRTNTIRAATTSQFIRALPVAATETGLSFDTEDKGNAERLIHYFGSQILHCAGKWLIWDGKRWARDDKKQVKTFGMQLSTIIMDKEYFPLWESIDEVDRIAVQLMQPKDLTPEQRALKARLDALQRQARLMRTDKGINAALSLAGPLRAVRAEELDADPWMLNAGNGIINLRTGQLQLHDPNQLITKLAPVNYNPHASGELWGNTLAQIFEDEIGLARFDEIRFLQKMLGYGLTGSVQEHAFFIFHGRRGRNGKGIINQAVEAIMGDYTQQIPADALLAKRNEGGGPSPSIAKIRGARLVFAKETDRGRRLDEALIKSLTGGDSITARFLFENEMTFRPTFKIVLETNYNPHVDGSDDGIWERIKKLDFLRHFEEHERDKTLGEKLQGEYEGILAWMVEGCLLWQREGLEETAEMRNSKREAHADSDPIITYVEDRLIFNRDAWVRPRDLFDDYQNWAFQNSEHASKKSEFKLRLQAVADRKKQRIDWNGRDTTGTARAVRGIGFASALRATGGSVMSIDAYRR
jgi:putative DNA primase/helicase